MIDTHSFIESLDALGIRFITGVPDSLLKNICAHISDHFDDRHHVIATNEGSSVALAIGHYLATGQPSLVYLQNSGIGNIVNPVTSLADPLVYGVPLLLLIGWRGEMLNDTTQISDEPQHIKQGQITLSQLSTLNIPYYIIDSSTHDIKSLLSQAFQQTLMRSGPVAIVVRKGTFSNYTPSKKKQSPYTLTREDAIKEIIGCLPSDALVVSTTGMASRELFELRRDFFCSSQTDFLTVGGMGHSSQIAAGISIACPNRPIICIDGDGSLLMHSGSLAINADCPNLAHIVINNESHDSVGGQPTKGAHLRFDEIAAAFGYKHTSSVLDASSLRSTLHTMLKSTGSSLLEVRCQPGSRPDLGRPDKTPAQNKMNFMHSITSP